MFEKLHEFCRLTENLNSVFTSTQVEENIVFSYEFTLKYFQKQILENEAKQLAKPSKNDISVIASKS